MGFNSFGGDFSAGIHDFLKERRETQRQAMLDALKQKEVESNLEIAKENMLSSKVQREALAHQYQQNALEDYINNAGLTADSELTDEQVAELERLGGKGMVTQGVVPNVQTQEQYFHQGPEGTAPPDAATRQRFAEEAASGFKPEGPIPPQKGKMVFRGKREDVLQREHTKKLVEIMNQLNDPNLSPIMKIMMLRAADPKLAETIGDDLIRSTPTEDWQVLNQDTGMLETPKNAEGKTRKVPSGTSPGTRSRPPQATSQIPTAIPSLSSGNNGVFRVSDGKGNTWLVDGQGNFISNVTGNHVPTGDAATGSEAAPLTRTPPQKSDAARAKQVTQGEREVKKQAPLTAKIPIIGPGTAAGKSNAKVQGAVKEVIADRESDNVPAQEIADSYVKHGLLTPQEAVVFVEALRKSRGQ